MDDKPTVTLIESYELYVLDLRASGCLPRTVEFYNNRIPKFFDWLTVDLLSQVTPTQIKEYLLYQKDERGFAPNTVHGTARAIRAWLNYCVRDELIESSPFDRVKMPKLPKTILDPLTHEDIQRLLNHCRTRRETAVVLFLLDSGVRAAEFVALNAEDININGGSVRIKQGKGQKDRVVYIGNRSRKALYRYWLSLPEKPTGDAPAFRQAFKRRVRMGRDSLFNVMRNLGQRAKVSPSTPHTLRRTFAIEMLRAGCDLWRLADLMGHEDITMLRRYLKFVDDDIRKAHDQFGFVDKL